MIASAVIYDPSFSLQLMDGSFSFFIKKLLRKRRSSVFLEFFWYWILKKRWVLTNGSIFGRYNRHKGRSGWNWFQRQERRRLKSSCEITRIGKRRKWIYKGKCPWRKNKSKHGAANRNQRLRYSLTAFFVLEIISGILWVKPENGMNFHIMRKDKGYQVEWGIPSWMEKGEPEETYGLRILPETWEIQFYHSQESIVKKP